MTVFVNEKITGSDGSVLGNQRGPQGLTVEQITALNYPVAYAVEHPKAGAYSVPTGFGTFPDKGWAICHFVTTTGTVGANQTPFFLHGGSTQNVLGGRIDSVANIFRPVFQCNNLNVVETEGRGEFKTPPNILRTFCITWDITNQKYARIIDGDYYEDTTLVAPLLAMTLTELRIGARNGGSDPLTGYVTYLEFGTGYYLSGPQMGARAASRHSFIAAPGGQSNVKNLFTGAETTTGAGYNAYNVKLASLLGGVSFGACLFVDTAEGGSGIFKATMAGQSAPENQEYWWDEDTNSPGPELLQWYERIVSSGIVPDVTDWDQAEAEISRINNPSTPFCTTATYTAQLLKIFNWMRSKFPALHIIIHRMGIRTGSYTSTYAGIQTICDIHKSFADTYSWCSLGAERFDLALYSDGVHYTDAAYAIMGQRYALSHARRMGINVSGGSVGPSLVSATRSGTTVTATISHDGGTDFTPTTLIQGFKYLDANGADVALSTISRASATTITMTLASAVAGTLYYIYDNATISDITKIVKDNGANTLPLQRGSVSVA